MKFSSEHKEYRKKLADQLNEDREAGNFDVAKKRLGIEEGTNEYKISKGIHQAYDNRELFFQKKMESYGFDVIDISSEIPKDINLLIDARRLSALDKKPVNLTNDFDEGFIKNYNEFLDKITEGKYSNIKNPNHVIGAYHGGLRALSLHTQEDSKYYSYLTDKISETRQLWVNFGENKWFDPIKHLAIFSLENPNFRRLLILSMIQNNDQFVSGVSSKNIYVDKKDITTFEQLEKVTHPDTLKEINKKIETLRREENGEIFYEIENGGVWKEEDREILPWMILKGLPIKVKNDDKTGGVFLDMQGFFRNMDDDGTNLFDSHPFTNSKLSFAAIADTIVDLPDKKVYKFNSKKESASHK